jgi:hypothetical protein
MYVGHICELEYWLTVSYTVFGLTLKNVKWLLSPRHVGVCAWSINQTELDRINGLVQSLKTTLVKNQLIFESVSLQSKTGSEPL